MDKITKTSAYGDYGSKEWYGEDRLAIKINELVEGHNEIIKRLERINHYMVTHKHINVDVK